MCREKKYMNYRFISCIMHLITFILYQYSRSKILGFARKHCSLFMSVSFTYSFLLVLVLFFIPVSPSYSFHHFLFCPVHICTPLWNLYLHSVITLVCQYLQPSLLLCPKTYLYLLHCHFIPSLYPWPFLPSLLYHLTHLSSLIRIGIPSKSNTASILFFHFL